MCKIKNLFYYLKWVKNRKPIITYNGFHCGCCGEYITEKFEIAAYKSNGEWCDTWGLCKKCK